MIKRLLTLGLLLSAAALALPATGAAESARAKFSRVDRFAKHLPGLMNRVTARLQQPKLDRDTAVATAIATMRLTGIRVGSQRYAARQDNPTRGAATLQHGDVTVTGDKIQIRFPGKKQRDGKTTTVTIDPQQDPLLVPALARAYSLFNRQRSTGSLLCYNGPRGPTALSERQVLGALKPLGGWNHALRYLKANELLDQRLAGMPKPANAKQAEANITSAIKWVGKRLEHGSWTTTRDHYIDPRRLDVYRQLRD